MDKKKFIPRIPKDREYLKRMWEDRIDSIEESEAEEEQPPVEPEPVQEPEIPKDIPKATNSQKEAYKRHFSAAIKRYTDAGNPAKLTNDAVMLYCCRDGLRLPSHICDKVILWADHTKDNHLNPKEFAKALHMMHHMLEEHYKKTDIPPVTPEQEAEYTHMFASVRTAGNYWATFEELKQASRKWNLPEEMVRSIWYDCNEADDDEDRQWTVDEFVMGYHHGSVQSERRNSKCYSYTILGEPILRCYDCSIAVYHKPSS